MITILATQITINYVTSITEQYNKSGCPRYPELLYQVDFKTPCFQSRSHSPFSIQLYTTNYSRNRPIYRMECIANEEPTFIIQYFVLYTYSLFY